MWWHHIIWIFWLFTSLCIPNWCMLIPMRACMCVLHIKHLWIGIQNLKQLVLDIPPYTFKFSSISKGMHIISLISESHSMLLQVWAQLQRLSCWLSSVTWVPQSFRGQFNQTNNLACNRTTKNCWNLVECEMSAIISMKPEQKLERMDDTYDQGSKWRVGVVKLWIGASQEIWVQIIVGG